MLQFMGLQRVGHDLVTEQQVDIQNVISKCVFFFFFDVDHLKNLY